MIKLAFWNLQNLFDTEASEISADLGFTPEKGWTDQVLDQKLTNLAEAINLMHEGQGPDLLGLCEVENRGLVDELVSRLDRNDYEVAHVETPDIRGIDTSLVFSRDLFELNGQPVGHKVNLRYPTRDIFEVPLKVLSNNAEITVFVNHWPSRRLGLYESEPFRLTVANHCGRLVDTVLKLPRDEFLELPDTQETLEQINDRWNRNVLLMGDFNDEPFNRSLLDYLKASSGLDHLEEPIKKTGSLNTPSPAAYLKKQAYIFNCMWPFLGIPDEGTFHYSEATNTMNLLDQFIISRGLFYGFQGLKLSPAAVEIFKPAVIVTAKKKRPKAFRFDENGILTNGYSDHFPVQALLETV